MSSQQKQNTPARNDNRGNPDNSSNLSPERQNMSQANMNKTPEELKREEEEELANQEFLIEESKRLEEMKNLVQLQRSDYISPVELGYLQSNFMV
jgi:hypothetical protein